MTHITTVFGLPRNVPFVDVDTTKDTRLFIDPFAVRNDPVPSKYGSSAQKQIETFCAEVFHAATSSSPAVRTKGKALVTNLSEPADTRLGYAAAGSDGHGSADVLGARIWDALTTDLNALVRVGILQQLEDIPMFVEDIGNDLTSDAVTRIIFRSLAQFTADMMSAYPTLATSAKTVRRRGWSATSKAWTEDDYDLPTTPDGKPLLLVPKPWVAKSLRMTPIRLYRKAILDYAQDVTATYTHDLKRLNVNKADLEAKYPQFERNLQNIIELLLRASGEGRNLVEELRDYTEQKYTPLLDDTDQIGNEGDHAPQ